MVGLMMCACGPADLRVGETKGIGPVWGTTEVSLQGF